MSPEAAGKVTAGHLARAAYLYVRQSTLRQELTNTESTARQYALRQKAVALGWPAGLAGPDAPPGSRAWADWPFSSVRYTCARNCSRFPPRPSALWGSMTSTSTAIPTR